MPGVHNTRIALTANHSKETQLFMMVFTSHCTIFKLAIVLTSIVVSLPQSASQVTNLTRRQIPAAFAFGDSIVDPGNNNVLKTIIRCDFPPYGKDFINSKATGRFSNGKIPGDFLVSTLGIKEYLPAYLGTNLSPEDLLTGVSFASGGNGYDPLTSALAPAISLDDQFELFKEYRQKLNSIAGEQKATEIISKSIFFICTGNDDIANNYYGPTAPFRRLQYDISTYVDFLVNLATTFVQKFLQEGATLIGLVDMPPVGCTPSQRTIAGGLRRDCEPKRNQAAKLFNSRMKQSIATIQSQNKDKVIAFVEIYDYFLDLIQRPSKYGFDESRKGCCGTGLIEVVILCNQLTPITCPDDTKYVFWDSFHPTERAYQLIIEDVQRRYSNLLS